MTTTPGNSRRAVVAEDEALIRLDIVDMLTEAGYEVVGQAGDGQAAIDQARQHHPDITVLDVKMPIMDGISAAEQITAAGLGPVVMLTAFSQQELVRRAADAGAMAYVVKPFTAADLLPAIEVALSRHQQIEALTQEISDLTQRLEGRKLIDRAKGVLQTRYGLSEPEAFRWIQKTSMDKRLTMTHVAETIVETGGDASTGDGAPT